MNENNQAPNLAAPKIIFNNNSQNFGGEKSHKNPARCFTPVKKPHRFSSDVIHNSKCSPIEVREQDQNEWAIRVKVMEREFTFSEDDSFGESHYQNEPLTPPPRELDNFASAV